MVRCKYCKYMNRQLIGGLWRHTANVAFTNIRHLPIVTGVWAQERMVRAQDAVAEAGQAEAGRDDREAASMHRRYEGDSRNNRRHAWLHRLGWPRTRPGNSRHRSRDEVGGQRRRRSMGRRWLQGRLSRTPRRTQRWRTLDLWSSFTSHLKSYMRSTPLETHHCSHSDGASPKPG